jgi:hypothetical protein
MPFSIGNGIHTDFWGILFCITKSLGLSFLMVKLADSSTHHHLQLQCRAFLSPLLFLHKFYNDKFDLSAYKFPQGKCGAIWLTPHPSSLPFAHYFEND